MSRMRTPSFALHLVRKGILFVLNSAAILCTHILRAAQFVSHSFILLCFYYARSRICSLFEKSNYSIICGKDEFSHYLDKLNFPIIWNKLNFPIIWRR